VASTQVTIAGIHFPSCVFNASGPRDVTLPELREIGASGSGAIVMKSCTPEPRDGNEEPRYADLPLGSINSMGLPNLGYTQYCEFPKDLAEYGKPVIASLAGMQPSDFPVLVEAFQKSDVDLIEVNLSCPNVKGKPQIGYDFEASDAILSLLDGLGDKPLGVKLPPYFDFVHFESMAAVLKKHKIAFITCVNSIGNALVIDAETERPVIRPKGGFGGLGGQYLKPTALANVRKFHELLGDRVQIIGVGGVYTGTDAFEFVLAGADAVQVGTAFMQEGLGCFARIDQELQAILDRKGYASAADAKGKLKAL
jgi:dihydroorotate dehydrogenase (fumarate)